MTEQSITLHYRRQWEGNCAGEPPHGPLGKTASTSVSTRCCGRTHPGMSWEGRPEAVLLCQAAHATPILAAHLMRAPGVPWWLWGVGLSFCTRSRCNTMRLPECLLWPARNTPPWPCLSLELTGLSLTLNIALLLHPRQITENREGPTCLVAGPQRSLSKTPTRSMVHLEASEVFLRSENKIWGQILQQELTPWTTSRKEVQGCTSLPRKARTSSNLARLISLVAACCLAAGSLWPLNGTTAPSE